ncbi:MAG: PilT/PilU family type 4a pilus ATPase [Candidatus Omnitrophica bacterium]|nr:PilT/PilU family type 4a pilus ATPase [Candidatus Omnitrophota bacterium]
MKDSQEKRAYQRYNIRIHFRYQILQKDMPPAAFAEANTNDLSVSGLSFTIPTEIPIDTKLRIELFIPQQVEPTLIAGRVVRIEQSSDKNLYIIGVAFSEINDADRQGILKNLENLNLFDLLAEVIQKGASDLHLTVNRPPIIRIQGKLHFLQREPIRNREIEAMIYPLLQNVQIENLSKNRELDFAFSPDLNSRFRVNLHWQRGFLEAALRTIPTKIKTLEELGLPEAVGDFAFSKHGLVIIAGPTNSGKTTTLAAMIEAINQKQEDIIICIEDPIEYVHKSKKCIIKQRELGVDTLSYAGALRRSLRQDPDVIMVGEIIDLDCILAALQAAETGHLVMTSIHAANAEQALERVVHMFPIEHKDEVCIRLSSCLQGVIAQLLLPCSDGVSQVLATEVLVSNSAVKHIIRENKLFQLLSTMQTGSQFKMHTFEKSIDDLFTKGQIGGNTLTINLQDIASKRTERK